jgi:hypothetical protein
MCTFCMLENNVDYVVPDVQAELLLLQGDSVTNSFSASTNTNLRVLLPLVAAIGRLTLTVGPKHRSLYFSLNTQ